MPEPVAGAFIWDDDEGALYEEELSALGVSPSLIGRLQAWFEAYDPPVGTAPDPTAEVGLPWSLRLATQLQLELPAHEVHLSTGRESGPLRDWLS
jgi:hypothetical protein